MKYFSYFPQKIGFDISYKLSPNNVHKMSNPISMKSKKPIINLSIN